MPGIFISLAISFLLFLYAPVDLYCANVSEFWFDFSTLLITALGMFAACFAVLIDVYKRQVVSMYKSGEIAAQMAMDIANGTDSAETVSYTHLCIMLTLTSGVRCADSLRAIRIVDDDSGALL